MIIHIQVALPPYAMSLIDAQGVDTALTKESSLNELFKMHGMILIYSYQMRIIRSCKFSLVKRGTFLIIYEEL